jgi:hypothetical protein
MNPRAIRGHARTLNFLYGPDCVVAHALLCEAVANRVHDQQIKGRASNKRRTINAILAGRDIRDLLLGDSVVSLKSGKRGLPNLFHAFCRNVFGRSVEGLVRSLHELLQFVLLLQRLALLLLVLLASLGLDQALSATSKLLKGLDASRILLRHDAEGGGDFLRTIEPLQFRRQSRQNSVNLGNGIVNRRGVMLLDCRRQIVSLLDFGLGFFLYMIERLLNALTRVRLLK